MLRTLSVYRAPGHPRNVCRSLVLLLTLLAMPSLACNPSPPDNAQPAPEAPGSHDEPTPEAPDSPDEPTPRPAPPTTTEPIPPKPSQTSRLPNLARPTPLDPDDLTTLNNAVAIKDLHPGRKHTLEASTGDIITVHLTAWQATDSDPVMSTLDNDRTLIFTLGKNQVPKGLDAGLQGMGLAGKRYIKVPAALMNDTPGALQTLPDNVDMVFEVTLVGAAMVDPTVVLPNVDTPTDITGALVTQTAGGVERVVLYRGKDSKPLVKGQRVVAHMTRWLADGPKRIDSTLDDHAPITLEVGSPDVIPGLSEGLLDMRASTAVQLKIPAALAYGDAGLGDLIPPNADLIIEATLLFVHD